MTKAFPLNFSMKALFFSLFERKERLPKLVRQPLCRFFEEACKSAKNLVADYCNAFSCDWLRSSNSSACSSRSSQRTTCLSTRRTVFHFGKMAHGRTGP